MMKPILLTIILISTIFAALPSGDTVTNFIGMKFKRIPTGSFIMGREIDFIPTSPDEWRARGDWDEVPAHNVTISNDFYIGRYEVTLGQFRRFMIGFSSGDTALPVRKMTWTQADSFCKWLTQNDPNGYTYRLPTEAEWEYACRAGTTTRFNTGDTLLDSQANMGRTSDGSATQGVVAPGKYAPNAWQLHDMHGNLLEWCSDWFGAYPDSNMIDPVGMAAGNARVVRGGSYLPPSFIYNNIRFCRTANRSGMVPDDVTDIVGIRVVIGQPLASTPLPVIQDAVFQRNVDQTASLWSPVDTPFFRYDNTHLLMKAGEWGPLYTWQCHVPNIAYCPNGDIFAIHYTEVSEGSREANAAALRLRKGASEWDSLSLFLTIPDVGLGANALYTDKQGIMWHFFTLALTGWTGGIAFRKSSDNGVTWTQPKMIYRAGWWTTACSAFESNDGSMLFFVVHNDTDSKLWITEDKGESWRLSQGQLKGIRAATVMLDDGRLVGFGRIGAINGSMPRSVSTDTGRTFTYYETPFPAIGLASSPTLVKLSNGAIILGSHDAVGRGIIPNGSGPHFVALSYDGGETWPHVRPTGYIGQAASAVAPNDMVVYFGTSVTLSAAISSGADAIFNEQWLKQGPAVPTTSIADVKGISTTFYLSNTPNPFNPSTVIRYSLPMATRSGYAVYSLDGRKIWGQALSSHSGSIVWDGKDSQGRAVPSGCYIGRLTSQNGMKLEHRLLFLK